MVCPPTKKYKINDLTDIDRKIPEGKLLFMALARLSCTVDSAKTPAEIIEIMNVKADEISREINIRNNE